MGDQFLHKSVRRRSLGHQLRVTGLVEAVEQKGRFVDRGANSDQPVAR